MYINLSPIIDPCWNTKFNITLLFQLTKKVDRNKWGMTPPTINAYYTPTKNQVNNFWKYFNIKFHHSMIFWASLLIDVVILIFFRLCSQLESCSGHSSTWRVPGASTMVLWVLSWVMSCHMLLMIRSAYTNIRNLRTKKITSF